MGIYAKKVHDQMLCMQLGKHQDKLINSKELLDQKYDHIQDKSSLPVVGKYDHLMRLEPIDYELPKNSHLVISSKNCIPHTHEKSNTLWLPVQKQQGI